MITDLTPYRKHVDQFDLSEEQKLELVNTLWVILENFVDHQLGINQLEIMEKEGKNSLDCHVQAAIIEDKPLGKTG